MGKLSKKLVSIVTAVVVMSGIAFTSLPAIEAKAVTTITTSGTETFVNPIDTAIKDQVESYSVSNYGLTDKTKDGVILHAFCWSFNTIKDNLADIAAAGYSTVQTSPANTINASHPNMKIVGSDSANGTDGMWWWHYQPTDWKIGNYQLGTKEEFKTMCAEAEKYGIKIIVDVLPNHTTPALNLVAQELKDAAGGNLYHENGFKQIRDQPNGWTNRLTCTTYMMEGLPDVNTENKGFQEYYLKYCNDIIASGGDGFRYDTAKHIGVPSDPKAPGVLENDFWPVAVGQKSVNGVKLNDNGNLFIYGEVLQDQGVPYQEYASYMEMTASGYGGKLRSVIGSKNFSASNLGNWEHPTPDKIVTWVESHDTYFNAGESKNLSNWDIKMCWAVIAARKQGTPLYMSRPAGSGNGSWYGNNVLGAKGDDMFKDPEVVAVNKFRNAMVGQSEYMRNPNGNSQILQIDRGTKGTVIINLGGDTSLNNDTTMANGTYTDQVTGGTFTVSGGKISGQLKAGKVHAIYNAGPVIAQPTVGVSQQGGTFKGDSLELTLTTTNSTSATYSLDGGAATTYTNGQKVTIGANTPVNGTITLKLSATGAEGTTPASQTYTFTKKDGSVQAGVYFNKPASWGTPTVYVYDDSVTPTKTNGAWPGVAMTDNGNGEYYYAIPSDFKNAKVIFASNGVQFPGAQQPGHAYTAGTALTCDGSTWTEQPIDKEVVSGTISIGGVSPYYVNKPIAISTSDATGGTGAITYKFEVGSEVISDFSSTKSVNWTPTTAGTYTVKVTAKDTVGKTATATKQVIIEKAPVQPLEITQFAPSIASPSKAGTAITLSAAGTGEGALSYKFSVNDGATNTVVKDFSTTSSAVWTPTEPGTYQVELALKDSTNQVVNQTIEYEVTSSEESVVVSKITTDKVSPQVVGSSIKITASAASSLGGPLTYKFTVHEGLLGFKTIKDYSSLSSATWTPTGSGLCTIVVEAKDALGNRGFNTLTYNITAGSTTTITKFATNVVSPQNVGTAITLSAAGTGTGTLNYRFSVNDGITSKVLKDYSTTSSVVWTPTKAGIYKISVRLKDSTGKVVSKTTSYIVTENKLAVTSFKANVVSPQKVGAAITLSATGTGTGTLNYRFSVNDGTTSTVLKDYSTTSSAVWTPTKAGKYTISVRLKDSRGVIVYKTMSYEVLAGEPVVISKISTDKVSPQAAGTAIKITAAAVSSKGSPLTYKFTVYEGLAGFKTIRDFSSLNYVTWTPTGTGTSIIFVEAKDALGNRTIQTLTYNITEQVSKVNFNDAKIQYVGTWNTLTTGKSTNQDGASMTFSFTGNSIQIVADKGSDKGVAIITIDGVQSEVDLYSSTTATGAIVFTKTGLASGTTHTIKIESFGYNNASSTNSIIKINSFNITNGTIK